MNIVKQETNLTKHMKKNSFIIGIAIGIAVGAALNNIGIGIAIGTAIGIAMSEKSSSIE
jgi:F0F1-type ATP synthase membrane subunit c/vacuolar-type H+-ATPase subunit K